MRNTILTLLVLLCCPIYAQTRAPRHFELKAESPKFWDLFAPDASLHKIAAGFGFLEGPVWDRRGFIYVSDEEKNMLSRVYPDGRVEALLSIGDPDGSTLDAKGRLVTTASVLRAIIRVEKAGRYKVLAERYEGKRFNSPNDIVLGPDGALYFTDPTLDLPKGEKQEIPFQGVYRLDNRGKVRLLTRDLTQPNGLAFSPDGKRLYIDDTTKREIRVYDVTAAGELQNGRLFGKEEGRGGVPDGMRVDMDDNVYVTGPGGIWVWDPDGNHFGTILLPESTANFNWGDAGYQTLYIAARTSVYRLNTKTHGFVRGARAKPSKRH
jgi:gluconolactonase